MRLVPDFLHRPLCALQPADIPASVPLSLNLGHALLPRTTSLLSKTQFGPANIKDPKPVCPPAPLLRSRYPSFAPPPATSATRDATRLAPVPSRPSESGLLNLSEPPNHPKLSDSGLDPLHSLNHSSRPVSHDPSDALRPALDPSSHNHSGPTIWQPFPQHVPLPVKIQGAGLPLLILTRRLALTRVPGDEHVNIERTRLLLLLRHSVTCPLNCVSICDCWHAKGILPHLALCKDDNCSYPMCVMCRCALSHFYCCHDTLCPVCVPLRETPDHLAPDAFINAIHEPSQHQSTMPELPTVSSSLPCPVSASGTPNRTSSFSNAPLPPGPFMFGSTVVPSVQHSQIPFNPRALSPFVFGQPTTGCQAMPLDGIPTNASCMAATASVETSSKALSKSFSNPVIASTELFHPCFKSLGTCSCNPKCASASTASDAAPTCQISPLFTSKFFNDQSQTDPCLDDKSLSEAATYGLFRIENVIWSIDLSYYCSLDLILEYHIWGPDGVSFDEFREVIPPPAPFCWDCGQYGHTEARCPDNVGWEVSGDDSESGANFGEEADKTYDEFIREYEDDWSNWGTELEGGECESEGGSYGDYDYVSTTNGSSYDDDDDCNSNVGSDGEDDGTGPALMAPSTEETKVIPTIGSSKNLRAAASPWFPSHCRPAVAVSPTHADTSVKVTLENESSRPLRATATPWSPLLNKSSNPSPEDQSFYDASSLVANMFKWNRLEALRLAGTDEKYSVRCYPERKRRSQECFCGIKVIVGTCWHYGTNYGRRSLICSNGTCRFMEVLPGNHHRFEEPLATLFVPRKNTHLFPRKPTPPTITHARKPVHRRDTSINHVLSLATCVKKTVISVIARPIDESTVAPVEKAWAVQILDGPEDVLQKARLLKVRNKVRLWRTRQRSTGCGTS